MKVENRSVAMLVAFLGALVLTVAAMTLAAAPAADARAEVRNQSVSKIFVDGEKVKVIRGNGSYRTTLSPGCYDIKVVTNKRNDTRSVSNSSRCSDEKSTLVVRVENGFTSIRTSS